MSDISSERLRKMRFPEQVHAFSVSLLPGTRVASTRTDNGFSPRPANGTLVANRRVVIRLARGAANPVEQLPSIGSGFWPVSRHNYPVPGN